jgi:hypothetical protein
MEIEIIDESEVVFARREKQKKHDTLYEKTLGNRMYWDRNGDDVKLIFILAKQKVVRENKKGKVVDFENDDYFFRLFDDQRKELIELQRKNMRGEN